MISKAATIRVSDYFPTCTTRDRGREFYSILRNWLASERHVAAVLTISFDGVEFVSPSFLDETVVRILRESSDVPVRVEGLTRMAKKRLTAVGFSAVLSA